MTTNQEFKNTALSALRGNWAKAVLATLVYAVVICLLSGATSLYTLFADPIDVIATLYSPAYWGTTGTSFLLMIFIGLPLAVGFIYSFCALYVYSDSRLVSNSWGYGFKVYWRAIGGTILMQIFVFLWSLLFVIPGIVKAYSYALTPYILVDDPQISVREAIRKSQKLMSGQKFNLFYLQLSFIGWFLLCCITGGIGFLWMVPYYCTSQAVFYRNLRDNCVVD